MAAPQDLTPEQFKAILTDLAKTVAPADPPKQTVLQKLMPHRQTLIDFRKQGYTMTQLVEFVKSPRINMPASAVTIRRVLTGENKRKARPSGKAKVTIIPPKPATSGSDKPA